MNWVLIEFIILSWIELYSTMTIRNPKTYNDNLAKPDFTISSIP